MAIPDYQTLMRPVLEVLSDSGVLPMRDLTERISDRLNLTEDERRETITSGMSLIANRVHWSVTYLSKAKAIERPQRGHVQITQRGRDLLASVAEIRNSALEQFPEYREFYDKYRSNKARNRQLEEPTSAAPSAAEEDESPDDLIARAEADSRSVLAAELLDKVRTIHPSAFERLVLKLLAAMGYGGLGEHLHTGQSNDKGLDGIITEDKLGLDRIYVQAKRYGDGNPVTPEQVRGFLGAMMGKGDRGVFLTASTFTKNAREAAVGVPARIVLIDGEELVELMIDHGVGVEPIRVATLHRINEDFFDAL
ncbi:restriction endonuclease [Microbacterium sp. XT11]|uniref:restriction endonuclease n=1 Tax=Microbacterium sp. XT11 TaxID=367477 RepID=UPI0009F8AA03|nr:restriction endonuclease [Microbacterium sp. XT11]